MQLEGDMVNQEIKIRNDFFIAALFIESNITNYISEKLKVSETSNSPFTGNKENTLNFNQKIELLLASEKLTVIEKSKISAFREIHKEFNKNKDVNTFEKCFTSKDKNDDFLLILYPQGESLSREEQLTNACYQLMDEVSQSISDFTKKAEVKLNKKGRFFNLESLKMSKFSFLFSYLFIK